MSASKARFRLISGPQAGQALTMPGPERHSPDGVCFMSACGQYRGTQRPGSLTAKLLVWSLLGFLYGPEQALPLLGASPLSL